jgi:DNA polymerase-3 subunit delta'
VNLGDLIGQKVAAGILERAVKSGRLAHAYLFEGPEGVGKRTAALVLARTLKCEKSGCGTCVICRKIESGNHPDVRLIGPGDGAMAGASTEVLEALGERASIGIDEIRQNPKESRSIPPPLLDDAYLKPYEGQWKVYVIDPADRMSPEAANALLHLLEEPPGSVVLVLVTCRPDALLPTVVSRCQKVGFRLVPSREIEQVLISRGVEEGTARLLAALAEGRIGWALQTASRPEWLETRARVLDWVAALPTSGAKAAIKCSSELHELALDTWRSEAVHSASFLAGEKLTQGQTLRARLPMIFDIIASWYRDALIIRSGHPGEAVNLDRLDLLREEAERREAGFLAAALSRLMEAKSRLRRNANPEITLDWLMLRLLPV